MSNVHLFPSRPEVVRAQAIVFRIEGGRAVAEITAFGRQDPAKDCSPETSVVVSADQQPETVILALRNIIDLIEAEGLPITVVTVPPDIAAEIDDLDKRRKAIMERIESLPDNIHRALSAFAEERLAALEEGDDE